jgi:hypothetical protein
VLRRAEAHRTPGRYQLQAAIAAGHAEGSDPETIAAVYDALLEIDPSPVVRLNRAVAIALAGDIARGLELIDGLEESWTAMHTSMRLAPTSFGASSATTRPQRATARLLRSPTMRPSGVSGAAPPRGRRSGRQGVASTSRARSTASDGLAAGDHALDRRPVAELHDRAPEPEREADLGQRPVAPTHGDHRVAGCRHREVPRVADAGDDHVVRPRVRVRVRLPGEDGDGRPSRLLGATMGRGHDLAEPARDDSAAALRQQATDLLGLRDSTRSAPDDCDLPRFIVRW